MALKVKKLNRGKPLEELVKGSLEYTVGLIRDAFRQQFPYQGEDSSYFIEETFADYVVVRSYSDRELKPGEYYQVSYSRDGENFTFAAREEWQVVELAYQPQSQAMPESVTTAKGKGRRLVDGGQVTGLLEVQAGQPRKIKGIGITADIVNGNGRRYPASALRAAVDELRNHLHESAGQGRWMEGPDQQQAIAAGKPSTGTQGVLLLGEPEHPADKATRRPTYLETVVKWTSVEFDGTQVLLEGQIIETSKGKDILALLEGGVLPGISQRAYGKSKILTENGRRVEEVTELQITGYDLVMEPSDPNAGITLFESKEENKTMDPEELKKMLLEMFQKNPTLLKGFIQGDLEQMSEAQLKAVEAQARRALGIGEGDDLGKALAEAAQAKRTLDAQAAQQAVEAAITEASKGLKYGEKLNGMFVQSLRDAQPANAEAVKALAEAKRKEYDALAAAGLLQSMGFQAPAAAGSQVQMVGPVFERETGQPEYTRAAFELVENIHRHEWHLPRPNLQKPRTVNEAFTLKYLEAFDQKYKGNLMAENRQFLEAEAASDLNLPYTVARAIVAEAFPTLVALGIFDVQMSAENPARIYYERHTAESGLAGTVTNESLTSDHDEWVQLANKRLTPGSVVLTDDPAVATYAEGSDYVVDYANGRIMALSTGTITDADALLVDYTYTAIRKGENQPIEQAKLALVYETLNLAADRLATEITREAVVFSRSQLNFDATARTLLNLVRQIQRKIDQGLIYMGLSTALTVASNSGGTWVAASDPVAELVKKIGAARVKVYNRFYMPTFLLLSVTNADRLANWDGFTAAGQRADGQLTAEGFVGTVKGLATFQSTEMSDSYGLIGNRELVMHRIGQPMQLFGPYPSYDIATGKLKANQQYYAEEFNGTEAPVAEKGSYIKIT